MPARTTRLCSILCATFVGISLFMAVPAQAQTPTDLARSAYDTLTPNYNWNGSMDRFLNGELPDYPKYDAWSIGWGQSYVFQTEVAMFEATGDTAHLDYVLDNAETMFAHRSDRVSPPIEDSLRNRTAPVFVSYNEKTSYPVEHAWAVHNGMVTWPVQRAIRMIKDDPALSATYGSRAAALESDIIQTVDAFDVDYTSYGGDKGRYVDPHQDSTASWTNGHVPYNHSSAIGRTYIDLWRSTGDTRFKTRAQELANAMVDELTYTGDHTVWRYAEYQSPGSVDDISHAAINVNFLVDAYEAGIIQDESVMQRLANTLRHAYTGPSGFTKYIDGSGGVIDSYSRQTGRWMRLAQYDPDLREDVLPYFQDYWDADPNAAVGTAQLESAAHYLLAGSVHDEPENSFKEHFDGPQIDYRWVRDKGEWGDNGSVIEWTRELGPQGLTVTDIVGSGSGYARVRRVRDVELDGNWSLSTKMTWDNTEGSADPDHALQRVLVEMIDANGESFGMACVNDNSAYYSGRRYGYIGGTDNYVLESYGSMAATGTAKIDVVTDDTGTHLYWNDVLFVSTPEKREIAQIAFRVDGHSAGHFGSVGIEYIEAVPEPATMGLLALGGVALLRRRRR